jgi:hypothetical protein
MKRFIPGIWRERAVIFTILWGYSYYSRRNPALIRRTEVHGVVVEYALDWILSLRAFNPDREGKSSIPTRRGGETLGSPEHQQSLY